jgi:hypothetical protein
MSGAAVDIAVLGLEVKSSSVPEATSRLDNFTAASSKAESATAKLSAGFDSVARYVQVAVAAMATWKLAKYIEEATLLAARAETLAVVMKVVGNNAGYTSAQMEATEKQVRKMGIATIEARESLTKMAGAQMDLTKASQLARVAQDAAVIGGINSSEAFGRMIQGIRSGETEILKTIGINVNFEQSYQKLAAQIGKNAKDLTEHEKVLARQNSVVEYGIQIQGAYDASMGTTGKLLTSLERHYKDLKIAFGEAFSPALGVMVDWLTESLKGLTGWFSENKSALSELATNLKDIASFGKNAVMHPLDTLTSVIMSPFKSDEATEQEARNRAADASYSKMLQDQAEKRRLAAGAAARAAQEAQEAQALANKEAKEAAKHAEQQEIAYVKMYNHIQDKRRESNPYLDDEQRALLKLRIEYDNYIATLDKALPTYAKHRAELERNYLLDKQQLELAQDMKRSIKDTSDYFKNYLQAVESESPQHNDTGQKRLKWEDELKLVESLQPSDAIDKLNDQIARFERMLADIPSKSAEVANAIARLKADFSASSGLDKLLQDNRNHEIKAIADPFEREKAQIKDKYETEHKLQEKALKDAAKNAELRAAIEKDMENKKADYIRDTARVSRASLTSQLSMVGDYASIASELFAGMSDAQDQSSRQGFESAKQYSLGAAIMSTAAAVIGQLTGPDAWTPAAWARSIAAGILGGLQVMKIANTTFGGGGSVGGVSAGFSAGGAGGGGAVGSGIGAPVTSIHDSQTNESLQRLAQSADNASLALGKVADGLTSIADLFGEGSQGKLMAGGLTSPENYIPSSNLSHQSQTITNVLAPLKNAFSVENMATTLRDAMGGGTLFGWGNSWYTKASGLNLGMSGGQLSARAYAERQKDGGWFSSDKHATDYSPLDPTARATLNSYLSSIAQTVIRSAAIMGTSANISAANLPASNIQTSGRTPEDIQKDLEAWFTKAADVIGQTVEGLKKFYGENAFDAAVRLSTSLQGVNERLELIGATLIDSSLKGANAAYHLQDLFGGLDKMGEKVDTYFGAMFTEGEQEAMKAAQAQRQINTAFAEMGVSVPANREQFRGLVDTLDLTTDRGAALFGALMDVSEAFGTVQDRADKMAKAQQESFQDLTLRTLTVQGRDAAASLLSLVWQQQQEIQDYLDQGLDITRLKVVQELEYQKAVKDTADTLRDAGNEMTAAADKIKQKLSDSVSAQMQIMETLKNLLGGDLSTLSPEAKYEQSGSAFRAAAGRARLGDVTALQQVSQLSQQFLQASRSYNASGPAYAADFASVTQTLAELGGLPSATEIQIEVAQQQLDRLTQIQTAIGAGNIDQLVYLKSILGANSGVSSLLEQYLKADQAAKDAAATAAANAQAVASAEQMTTIARQYSQIALEYSVGKRTGYDSRYDVGPLVNGAPSQDNQINTGDAIVWLSIADGKIPMTADIIKRFGLPAYAGGGITSGLSIAGEAGPEAVVPLPDGRRIPVQMAGRADNRETAEGLEKTVAALEKIVARQDAQIRQNGTAMAKLIALIEQLNGEIAQIRSKARLEAAA